MDLRLSESQACLNSTLERCAIMLEAINAPLPADATEFDVLTDPPESEQGAESCVTCPACGCAPYTCSGGAKIPVDMTS